MTGLGLKTLDDLAAAVREARSFVCTDNDFREALDEVRGGRPFTSYTARHVRALAAAVHAWLQENTGPGSLLVGRRVTLDGFPGTVVAKHGSRYDVVLDYGGRRDRMLEAEIRAAGTVHSQVVSAAELGERLVQANKLKDILHALQVMERSPTYNAKHMPGHAMAVSMGLVVQGHLTSQLTPSGADFLQRKGRPRVDNP